METKLFYVVSNTVPLLSFYRPITDVFFTISLELVCRYNDGWITGSAKEEIICSAEIPVQDVMSLPAKQILEYNIPFTYTDVRRAKLAKQLNVREQEIVQPTLRLKIANISSARSYFAPSYGDYVETVKMDGGTFSKQLLKLSVARLTRIAAYLVHVTWNLRNIYHFKYPFFSYLALMVNYPFLSLN